MKAFVINLDSAKERMAFQTKQLNSLAIEFQRLPAYKIASIENKFYQKYFDTWQRPLSISEVSCFLSHKKAWDLVIKENQPMLILEDDAWLSENVPMVLKRLKERQNIDYINLEVTGSNNKKLLAKKCTDSFCDINLLRLFQGRSGTGAYIIWPNGARKLLEKTQKGSIGLVDKFINTTYALDAFQIEPAIVIQLDQCRAYGITAPLTVKTSISTKANITVTFRDFVRYKIRRAIGEIKIGINIIRHKHLGIRRGIELSKYFKETKF